MRYASTLSFFKHLKNSLPNHLCKIYLILSEDDYERRKIVEKSASILSAFSRCFHSATMESILYELSSPSLFSSCSIVGADFSSSLGKKDKELLLSFLQQKKEGIIILGLPSKEGMDSLSLF